MNMKTWLRKHHACPEGYAWAVSSCKTMQDVWDTAKSEWLVWVATRPGVLDDDTLIRFLQKCAEYLGVNMTIREGEKLCDTAWTEDRTTSIFWGWDCLAQWLETNATPNFEDHHD
jgi:hypothetical protein